MVEGEWAKKLRVEENMFGEFDEADKPKTSLGKNPIILPNQSVSADDSFRNHCITLRILNNRNEGEKSRYLLC